MYASLDELIQGIYAAALDSESWEPVLRLVGDAIGADTIGLGLGLPAPGPEGEGWVVEVNADPRFTAALGEAFGFTDEATSAFLTAAVGATHTFSRMLGPRYRRTAFYNECLLPHGYGEGLFVTASRGGGQQSGLGCFRTRDRPDFSDDDVSLVATLLPHVQLALQMHARLAEAARDRRAAWQAIDALTIGVLVVDARGRIVEANPSGEQMLRARDGLLRDRGGMLRASRSDSEHRLAGALRAAFGDRRNAARGTLALQRPSGLRPLQVLVAPMRCPVGGSWAGTEAAAVVFVSDPEQEPGLPEDDVRALFGLTRAEARVSVQLALGASPAEIADRSGVQLDTVRVHIKRIYAKTGTRRQAELVRLLLRSPPLLLR